MTDEMKEIRSVLLGRTKLTEDGMLTALERGEFRLSSGVTDGAGAVMLLGMARKAVVFETEAAPEDVLAWAESRMQDMGRAVWLRNQPEAAACMIRYVLTKPAVLVFGYEDGEPVLKAWAGRGIMGRISLRRATGAFLKSLPEEIKISAKKAPPERKKKAKTSEESGENSE